MGRVQCNGQEVLKAWTSLDDNNTYFPLHGCILSIRWHLFLNSFAHTFREVLQPEEEMISAAKQPIRDTLRLSGHVEESESLKSLKITTDFMTDSY